jgi:enamine deaminase RidA (YjgF/YER057c/UK114 family)
MVEEIMSRITAVAFTFVMGTAVGALAQSGLLRYLNPPGLSTPTGYTHVVIPQGGRPVFIAGQVANDKSGTVVGKGDFKAQTTQVFENLKTAVEAAGGTMADVAKITIYVTTYRRSPRCARSASSISPATRPRARSCRL